MKIVVTGGAGFIGSHVADAALEQGHSVVVVDDLSSGKRENVPAGAEFVELDIRDAEGVRGLIERVRPDAISHQAAQASVAVSVREPARDAAINTVGTVNLLESAMPPLGLAVTVPHKQAVMGLCDRVTPLAAEIGAVNCVVFEPGGEVVGYNTDAPGYVDGLRIDLGYEPARRRVTLLGSGGAARAVAAGLHDAGAESVTVVARSPDKADWTEALPWTADALAELLPRTDLLVDCTSVGLDPASEARVPTPVDVDQLPASAVVSSLIYHRTPALLRAASDRGLRTQGGGPMPAPVEMVADATALMSTSPTVAPGTR